MRCDQHVSGVVYDLVRPSQPNGKSEVRVSVDLSNRDAWLATSPTECRSGCPGEER